MLLAGLLLPKHTKFLAHSSLVRGLCKIIDSLLDATVKT